MCVRMQKKSPWNGRNVRFVFIHSSKMLSKKPKFAITMTLNNFCGFSDFFRNCSTTLYVGNQAQHKIIQIEKQVIIKRSKDLFKDFIDVKKYLQSYPIWRKYINFSQCSWISLGL